MMPPASSKSAFTREAEAAPSRQTSSASPFDLAQPLHTLHFYGAAGIAAFGWALSRALGFSCAHLAPLWFCGGLLVYNFDRLKPDPADAVNTPRRLRAHGHLRKTSRLLALASAALVVALPIFWREWRLLALALVAGASSLAYSFPMFGFRWKDVPIVKTLFAPTIATLAYFLPPLLDGTLPRAAIFGAEWTWLYCVFNMTLCDLRDLAGDRRFGTASIPVCLGEKHTRRLLLVLIPALAALAFANGWFALGVATSGHLGALLFALRKNRGEAFYEWFAEGMLFLPALVLLSRGSF